MRCNRPLIDHALGILVMARTTEIEFQRLVRSWSFIWSTGQAPPVWSFLKACGDAWKVS